MDLKLFQEKAVDKILKEVKEILRKYSLQVKTKSRQGLYVEGDEHNKRHCLVKEKINCHRYSKEYRPLFSHSPYHGHAYINVTN